MPNTPPLDFHAKRTYHEIDSLISFAAVYLFNLQPSLCEMRE